MYIVKSQRRVEGVGMNEITESKLKSDGHRLDGASLERTVSYENSEGVVTEKTSLNYKNDSGNVIDNAVNEVRNSEYIKKAGNSAKNVFSSLVKLVLTVGILGFIIFIVAIMLGAVQ